MKKNSMTYHMLTDTCTLPLPPTAPTHGRQAGVPRWQVARTNKTAQNTGERDLGTSEDNKEVTASEVQVSGRCWSKTGEQNRSAEAVTSQLHGQILNSQPFWMSYNNKKLWQPVSCLTLSTNSTCIYQRLVLTIHRKYAKCRLMSWVLCQIARAAHTRANTRVHLCVCVWVCT